ncbi:MAG: DUF5057 domain-containing protein [Eubacterium sp.]|nr:DUF5057 domain-containing protein [Eubacterium sp.]
MGFTGYYVAGEESVRKDIAEAINDHDETSEDLSGIKYDYYESTLSDSNLRYELADKMLLKLNEKGVLNSVTEAENRRSILTAPMFTRRGEEERHVDGYFEGYECEWNADELNSKIQSGVLTKLNKDTDGKKKLKDKDTPTNAVPEPYIDVAKGEMVAQLSGNFIMEYDMSGMSEDAGDIASEFVSSYILNKQQTGYSLHSLVYTGVIDGNNIDEDKYDRRLGDFDPAVAYYISTGKEANTRVTFGVNKGATYGYVVSKSTLLNSTNVLDVKYGTPIYTYDGKAYVFAGYYGTTEELTLSMNSLSANNVSGSVGRDYYMAVSEEHPNTVMLSSGDEILGDTDILDMVSEPDSNVDNENNESVDKIEQGPDENITDFDSTPDTEGDEDDDNDPEEDEGENDEPTPATTDYYTLQFEYSPKQDYVDFAENYYTVLSFEAKSADEGGEYYIDIDSERPIAGIVNCDLGKGSIGLVAENEQTDDDLKYFVFEYAKGRGTYNWIRADYASDDYVNANVYRVKGVDIYYGFNITNSEWFKQYVFDRDKDYAFPIDVVNMKVSEVTEEDVSDANLVVVMGGDASLCLGDDNSFKNYKRNVYERAEEASENTVSGDVIESGNRVRVVAKDGNDLDVYAYKRLIEKLAISKMPVIGDYKIVEEIQNSNDVNMTNTWVYNLVRVLMLKPQNSNFTRNGFNIYYDAIGNRWEGLDLTKEANQFDPADTTNVRIDNSNANHFVYNNGYVYNMRWSDQASGERQNYVNPYMYTMAEVLSDSIASFSEEEINAGFSEVLEDIRSENRYRITDNREDKQLPETITMATAIRYIIGFANKREVSIKGKLRILEIEPTASFDLYIEDNGDNYNSYGMSGHSYDTKNKKKRVRYTTERHWVEAGHWAYGWGGRHWVDDSHWEGGETVEEDLDNYILYRNGTYKSITDEANHKASTGKIYRRPSITVPGKTNNGNTTVTGLNDNNIFINLDGIDLELTRMSVGELIGHIDDLNAEYDLIYIGMNTQLLNTEGITDVPVYNDTDMKGMVYTSIGDKKDVWPVLASYGDNLISRYTATEERYNGNDITEDYVNKLTQFADASYPIILDDGFFENVNAEKDKREISNRVDSVSYMYQFADEVKNKQSVYSVSDVKKDSTGFFRWLLNLEKPEIVIKPGSPASEAVKELNPDDQLLSGETFRMYGYELTLDAFDGQFHLPFDFSIKNMGAASSDSKYTAKLYVDLNADGKYSERERIEFTSIREDGSSFNNSGEGMKVDKEYYAQCEVPSSFDGVVPWRMVVYQEDHPERRTNATGYYRLKKNEPVKIDILQLDQRASRGGTENGGTGSKWNMEATYTKGVFGDLMDAISDYYDVTITTKAADVWEQGVAGEGGNVNAVNKNTYYADLRKYDMIIIGFADCYQGPKSENAMEAIEKYIRSERSVLFTHDTTSFYNFDYFANIGEGNEQGNGGDWHWGYYFNKHVRNVVGMDRYNVMGGEESEFHSYDKAYKPGEGTRMKGTDGKSYVRRGQEMSTNRGVGSRDINAKSFNNTGYKYNNLIGIGTGNGQAGGGSLDATPWNGNVVTQVNDGQITKFPFALHKSFAIAPTHSQYYQLDFTDDADRDGEKDIVVWYCISDAPSDSYEDGDMYEMSPNDVRNNYYIYNKGSITYSGVGHQHVVDDNGNPMLKKNGNSRITTGKYNLVDDVGNKDNTDELKLFINTMIAAYQSGVREPSLKAVKSYIDPSSTGSLYISYDQQRDELDPGAINLLDTEAEIYFSASRANYSNTDVDTIDNLKIRMYYEATEEEYNAYRNGTYTPKDKNGNDSSVVELDPLSIEYDYQGHKVNESDDKYTPDPAYYHRYDDGNDTEIYGIPILISNIQYKVGGGEAIHSNKDDDPSKNACGIDEFLKDGEIYKATITGIQHMKSMKFDGSNADAENLWYLYDDSFDTSLSSNQIQGKSLNNRRIILVVTNDTYNTRTDIGREESAIQYVNIARAKMFMLE